MFHYRHDRACACQAICSRLCFVRPPRPTCARSAGRRHPRVTEARWRIRSEHGAAQAAQAFDIHLRARQNASAPPPGAVGEQHVQTEMSVPRPVSDSGVGTGVSTRGRGISVHRTTAWIAPRPPRISSHASRQCAGGALSMASSRSTTVGPPGRAGHAGARRTGPEFDESRSRFSCERP